MLYARIGCCMPGFDWLLLHRLSYRPMPATMHGCPLTAEDARRSSRETREWGPFVNYNSVTEANFVS